MSEATFGDYLQTVELPFELRNGRSGDHICMLETEEDRDAAIQLFGHRPAPIITWNIDDQTPRDKLVARSVGHCRRR